MKKFLFTLSIAFLAFQSSFAQWNTGTNISNSNTGFVGIQTSLYVSDPGFLYGSIANGSVVVGSAPTMGVYIVPPVNSEWQHSIHLDQTNNDILIGNGNSDGGGGIQRPGINTGETRIFTNNGYSVGTFMTFWENSSEIARFDGSGNFAIGTTNANGYKLAVNGTAIATAMTVKAYSNWPDYVFKYEYKLPSLNDVKTYIDQNHHLPDMPSAKEVEKEGINLGEMNKLLVKKVEELTLYMIQLKEENEKLKKEQQEQIDALKKQIENAVTK